jgi:hypothetical protein
MIDAIIDGIAQAIVTNCRTLKGAFITGAVIAAIVALIVLI